MMKFGVRIIPVQYNSHSVLLYTTKVDSYTRNIHIGIYVKVSRAAKNIK